MASFTLATLRTRARQRADMAVGGFVSDSELDAYINEGYGELYDLLASDDYYMTSVDFTLAGGSGGFRYTVPSALYKLRSVERDPDSSVRTELQRVPFSERNGLGFRAYCLIGSTIEVYPFELAAGSYRAYYIPERTALVSTSDALNAPNGWEEIIILNAAIRMLNKEESDVSAHVRERAEIRARIASYLERDASRPARVGDVYASPSNFGDIPWDYR